MFSPAEYPLDPDSQDPWEIIYETPTQKINNDQLEKQANAVQIAQTLDTPFVFPKQPILFADLTDLKGFVMTHKITDGYYIVMPVSCVGRIRNDLRYTTAHCSLIPQ